MGNKSDKRSPISYDPIFNINPKEFDIDYKNDRNLAQDVATSKVALKIWMQFERNSIGLFDSRPDLLFKYLGYLFGCSMLASDGEYSDKSDISLGAVDLNSIILFVIKTLEKSVRDYRPIIINQLVEDIINIKSNEHYDKSLVLYKMVIIKMIVGIETCQYVTRYYHWEFESNLYLGTNILEKLFGILTRTPEKTMYLAIILSYKRFRHEQLRPDGKYLSCPNDPVIRFINSLDKIDVSIISKTLIRILEHRWVEYIASIEGFYEFVHPLVFSRADCYCLTILTNFPVIATTAICDAFCHKFKYYVNGCLAFRLNIYSDIKYHPLWFIVELSPDSLLQIVKLFQKHWAPYLTRMCFYSAIFNKNVDILQELFKRGLWKQLKRYQIKPIQKDLLDLLEYNNGFRNKFVAYYHIRCVIKN